MKLHGYHGDPVVQILQAGLYDYFGVMTKTIKVYISWLHTHMIVKDFLFGKVYPC